MLKIASNFKPPPAAAAKSLQSCPTLCDPIDGSPPGSPIPGMLQARTLEQVALSFSNAWKWKMKVKSLSCVRLLATPRTAAYQAPPSVGFSRQEYWSAVPLPPLGLVYFFPEFCIWYLQTMKLWKVKLQIRGNYGTKKAEIIALHFQSSITQSSFFSWEVLSVASLLRDFNLNKCWIVPTSSYIDIKNSFSLPFLLWILIWSVTLSDLWCLKTNFHSGTNSTLSWGIILLIHPSVLLTNILLSIFVFISKKILACKLYFMYFIVIFDVKVMLSSLVQKHFLFFYTLHLSKEKLVFFCLKQNIGETLLVNQFVPRDLYKVSCKHRFTFNIDIKQLQYFTFLLIFKLLYFLIFFHLTEMFKFSATGLLMFLYLFNI